MDTYTLLKLAKKNRKHYRDCFRFNGGAYITNGSNGIQWRLRCDVICLLQTDHFIQRCRVLGVSLSLLCDICHAICVRVKVSRAEITLKRTRMCIIMRVHKYNVIVPVLQHSIVRELHVPSLVYSGLNISYKSAAVIGTLNDRGNAVKKRKVAKQKMHL